MKDNNPNVAAVSSYIRSIGRNVLSVSSEMGYGRDSFYRHVRGESKTDTSREKFKDRFMEVVGASLDDILNENATPVRNLSESHSIPIYDIEIDAGNINRLIDANNNIPVVGHLNIESSENSSGLLGVRAKGDSMATFINGGDTMLIRKLTNWDFIPRGNAYVIIGKEVSVVKYIRNGPTPDEWLLRSHNEYYEDFIVSKKDILHLFIVVKVLKELTY